MARSTNNELVALPGFFFGPRCEDGLVKLTDDERYTLLQNQGNYAVMTFRDDPAMKGELDVACDNGRIPTHRRPDAEIPDYGSVPIDLREVVDLKGMD